LIAGAALRQLVAPREARGRVLASYNTLANAAMVAALGLGVGLMSWLGARGVFLAAGALTVMAAALTAVVLRILPKLAGSSHTDRKAVLARHATGQDQRPDVYSDRH
jgi:MFS family permease